MFEGGLEQEYKFVLEAAIANGQNCQNDPFDCVGQSVKDKVNGMCDLGVTNYYPPKPQTGSGGSGGNCNPNNIFVSEQITVIKPIEFPNGLPPTIYPIHSLDPSIEKNAGMRDYFVDNTKDFVDPENAKRYVYFNVLIKRADFDKTNNPDLYFRAALKPDISLNSGNISFIDLGNCLINFPNYTKEQQIECNGVRNFYIDKSDNIVFILRLPIKTNGPHHLIINRIAGGVSKEYGKYSFNILTNNTVTYNKNDYSGTTRDLPLNLLEFPSSSIIPKLKDSHVSAFSTLEESIEDAFSLNEKISSSHKRTFNDVKTGINIIPQHCELIIKQSTVTHLSMINRYFDKGGMVKINVERMLKIKNDIPGASDEYILLGVLAEMFENLIPYFTSNCPGETFINQSTTYKFNSAIALLATELVWANRSGQLMNVDVQGNLVQGLNNGVTIDQNIQSSLGNPKGLFPYVAFSLTNIANKGMLFAQFALLFDKYIQDDHKTITSNAQTLDGYRALTLIHELAHNWDNRYMMLVNNTLPVEIQHQAYCSGYNTCDFVFRYDNKTDAWLTRLNDNGAVFCESHRHFLLNTLVRKP